MDCGARVTPGGVQSPGPVHTVGVQEMCFDRGARGQASANAAPGNFRVAFLPSLHLLLFGFGIFFLLSTKHPLFFHHVPENGRPSLGPAEPAPCTVCPPVESGWRLGFGGLSFLSFLF